MENWSLGVGIWIGIESVNQSIYMVHKSGLRRSCLAIEILSKQKVRSVPAVVSPPEILDKHSFYNAL
jgi:hypothetical protein